MTYMKVFLFTLYLLFTAPRFVKGQWVQTNGLEGGNVISLATIGNDLFAGTVNGGVFLSSNNGSTWSNVGLQGKSVGRLSAIGTTLFAAIQYDEGGIFASTNRGASWTLINNGFTTNYARCFATIGTTLFAGSEYRGIFRTTNLGLEWTKSNASIELGEVVYAMAVHNSTLFAGTTFHIYRSTNLGLEWTTVDNGLPKYFSVNALSVIGENTVASTNTGIFVSSDEGQQWSPAKKGLPLNYVYTFCLDGSNLFASSSTGLYVSADSGWNWIRVSSDLASINSLIFSDSNLFAGTANKGLSRSTNRGASWHPYNKGLIASGGPLAVLDNKILAGGQEGFFESSDKGQHWSRSSNLASKVLTSDFVFNDSKVLVACNEGILQSSDLGKNWSLSPTEFSNPLGGTFSLVSLALADSLLFVGTDGGGIYISTDNAKNWKQFSDGLPYRLARNIPPYPRINSLTVKDTFILAATARGLFKSSMMGGSWSRIDTGYERDFGGLFFRDSIMFSLISGVDLFRSTDDGVT
jgi:photosystem II stability/assembly factor-like uncharacterized protein